MAYSTLPAQDKRQRFTKKQNKKHQGPPCKVHQMAQTLIQTVRLCLETSIMSLVCYYRTKKLWH